MARTNRRREKNIDDMLDRKRKISDKKKSPSRKNLKSSLRNVDINNLKEEDIEEFYE